MTFLPSLITIGIFMISYSGNSTVLNLEDRLSNSPNFKNGEFHNLEPLTDKNFSSLIKFWMGEWKKWPKWVENEFNSTPPNRVNENNYQITFINHASFLIQIAGLNIITDPHYTQRTSPVSFMGPKRVRKPAVDYKNLPPIDLVFISHNHFDHMDEGTIKMLWKDHKPKFLVGLNNAHYLTSFGVEADSIVELDWWESFQMNDTKFHFVPVQHWSKRGLSDTRKSLWGGMMLEHDKFLIYHAGDTGYGKHFKMTSEKLGSPDIALIPIGAYEPRDFMRAQHLNPDDAVLAHNDLKSKYSIGMHFGTFQLTYEGIGEPETDLEKAKEKYSVANFVTPKFGQEFKGTISK